MSGNEIALRFVPKDKIFRPREALFLTLTQIYALLNAGLIEERTINNRKFYRKVT